jgi:hypothetical protein
MGKVREGWEEGCETAFPPSRDATIGSVGESIFLRKFSMMGMRDRIPSS